MQLADLAALSSLAAVCMAFPWDEQQFFASLDQGDDALVLINKDQRIGFIISRRVSVDEAELLNIAVDPAYQRQGLARLLLDTLRATYQHAGIKHWYLELRASNTAALACYTHYGFVLQGRRRDYYPAMLGREDALLMKLESV
jgi:ribosomal-protein-alanine N-acetyltransferase